MSYCRKVHLCNAHSKHTFNENIMKRIWQSEERDKLTNINTFRMLKCEMHNILCAPQPPATPRLAITMSAAILFAHSFICIVAFNNHLNICILLNCFFYATLHPFFPSYSSKSSHLILSFYRIIIELSLKSFSQKQNTIIALRPTMQPCYVACIPGIVISISILSHQPPMCLCIVHIYSNWSKIEDPAEHIGTQEAEKLQTKIEKHAWHAKNCICTAAMQKSLCHLQLFRSLAMPFQRACCRFLHASRRNWSFFQLKTETF